MHLVQILLPLRDNEGQPYSDAVFQALNHKLAQTFGGVTAFSRSPARGVWINNALAQRDDVMVVEVMTEVLDPGWWAALRGELERDLRQQEIVIRAHAIARL